MDPKRLPPSLRTKSRYIVFEVISDGKVVFEDVQKAIWNSVAEWLGELGSSEARLWIVKNMYNDDKQIGIIKCSHDRVEHVRSSLAFVKIIGETRSIIRILGVSGTIKSARLKYIEAGKLH